MPGVHFEPPSGSVPSAPTLYLFVPSYWAPPSPAVTAVDASGKKVVAKLAAMSARTS